MLAVSALIPTNDGRDQPEMEVTSDHFDFPEFGAPGATCLLDSIDFDDFFVGIHDGDVLPDLEMDSDLLAEFSVCPSSAGDQEEDSAFPLSPESAIQVVPNCYSSNGNLNNLSSCITDEGSKKDAEDSAMDIVKDEEIESKKPTSSKPPAKEKTKKPSSSQAKNNNNNNNNKRKTKVDWTADLHRRFVQAVEQLGVEKAVPSRILELMGNDCLTRHNVASHLQKYRSHRKHLLAREAEAVSWSQKRQMYGIAVAPAAGGGGKSKVNRHQPYIAPTIGFPPPMTPPPPVHHHPYHRPLHVWGHPTHHVEHQPMMPLWPKQLVPPPATWAAAPPGHHPRPPVDPSLWHTHHQHRFAAPPVPGIPTPHTAVYKHEAGVTAPPASQSGPNHTPLDYHPTKESIDAVIGDVLSQPWLPLPIGLKPPSTDSVMGELQRQGIPSVPPSSS